MNNIMLLTGGNSGIGYFMVRQWLEDGNRAAVLDVSIDNLEALKEKFPDSLLPIVCDVTDAGSVQAAADKTIGVFGSVDFAVHNACVCPFKTLGEHTLDDYRRAMEVNFIGAVLLTKAVLPHMLSRKSGSVCLTSSGVGVTGFPGISAYAASKGAIESFARCMRLEHLGTGVAFHILHPPLTDTKSAEPLPVPREFKASAEKVGRGLARRLGKKSFVIAPSAGDTASVKGMYHFPLGMGSLLVKMTAGAKEKS
jgi:NAD(P)-dependent dehydrogenase (short-subunit alcohol dehydrogenase family)